MKNTDIKSFLMRGLLTATISLGVAAKGTTGKDKTETWDAKQQWEVKTSTGKIPAGWEPFAYDSNDQFDPFLIRRRIK